MSAAFPLTFLSLQKAEPHKHVVAPTNEERLQAFRRFAPALHTNNNFFRSVQPHQKAKSWATPITEEPKE